VGTFKDLRTRLDLARVPIAELLDVKSLDTALEQDTRTHLSKAKEGQVLEKLAAIPIENMKAASDRPIRAETLRKYGITTVASIYLSSVPQLARISGISEEGAFELKAVADQMFTAIATAITYGFDLENLTSADEQLLESVQGLEGVRRRLRGHESNLRPIAERLQASLQRVKPLDSRLAWIFAGSERRRNAINAVQEITAVLADPRTTLLLPLAREALTFYRNRNALPAPVDDFTKRASDYYSTLEEVSGARPQVGQRHFSAELIDRIHAQEIASHLISATLRKYQKFGSQFALAQNRVIIGDEMGLGKTLQALTVLAQRSTEGANRFLIVCPASVLVNWQREISSRTSLPLVKIHGTEQRSALANWRQFSGIALTTFDTLKSFDFSDAEISGLGVDTVVVDEAHYVKNLETGRAKTMMRWIDKTPRVIFLTGTPLENRVDEFINLASLLDRDFAGRLNHAALAAGAEAFRHHVAPMYLRRNADEVLNELPERIEVEEYCSWDGADFDFYTRAVASGNFMAMRRAGMRPARDGVLPSKMIRLLELTREAFDSGKKVIIYSYFKDVLSLVAEQLATRAVGPVTGSVSPNQRQDLVDQFTASEEPLALVGQIQAAGTGLNIQAASVVIICEPQIKPSLEVQAIARAHRMGQVRTVQVHRLIIPEGIDELMMDMLAAKQADFDVYARESELANAAESTMDHTEDSLAKHFVASERNRLAMHAENAAFSEAD